MDCGLLDSSLAQVQQNRIAARAAINLFRWQLHTLWHGEMVKKIYAVIGITSVGASDCIADQRIFKF
jgi:hypothetical protein